MLFEIGNNHSIPDNIIILNENNKIGLSKTENGKTTVICKCEYDSIDIINNSYFLCKGDIICYYNSFTDEINNYNEVILDVPYIYSCDNSWQYIINMETGKTIYKKRLNKYNKSNYICFGNTAKGHVFYDSKYGTYLYPTDNGYVFYNQPVNNAVIINDNNVTNIVENENGIGLIDSFGNSITDCQYDTIAFELKVTAADKNKETNINIPYKMVQRRS